MLTEMRLEECELDCALIGKRVRTARKAKKVTQEELSGHCGCTPTHICNLENGKIGISLELLFMGLCDIYNYWKEYGYEKPVIKETIYPDRITLTLNIEYEGNRGVNDGNHEGNDGNRDGNNEGNLSEMEKCIFSIIKENNTLSAKKIAEKLGISASTVERVTKKIEST